LPARSRGQSALPPSDLAPGGLGVAPAIARGGLVLGPSPRARLGRRLRARGARAVAARYGPHGRGPARTWGGVAPQPGSSGGAARARRGRRPGRNAPGRVAGSRAALEVDREGRGPGSVGADAPALSVDYRFFGMSGLGYSPVRRRAARTATL